MNQYERSQYFEAQQAFLNKFANHCDYAITLQSSVSSFNLSDAQMSRAVESVSKSVSTFRTKLNRLLTGNGYRRKAEYVPLLLTAIEGSTDNYTSNRTLHVHIALGNTGHIKSERTRSLIEHGCREIWSSTAVGTADVRVDSIRENTAGRWVQYICKESQYKKFDVIDYQNTQVPQHMI